MLNNYKITIDFSYEMDSEKDANELRRYLEEELNNNTRNYILQKKRIEIKQFKKRIRLAEFEPKEVLNRLDVKKRDLTINGKNYSINMDSIRYIVFKNSLRVI